MRRTIEWPDGKMICATFTVAFEAFTKGGHFKRQSGLDVNLASISHSNYGGNVGIWRIMEICERTGVGDGAQRPQRRTLGVEERRSQSVPRAARNSRDDEPCRRP